MDAFTLKLAYFFLLACKSRKKTLTEILHLSFKQIISTSRTSCALAIGGSSASPGFDKTYTKKEAFQALYECVEAAGQA